MIFKKQYSSRREAHFFESEATHGLDSNSRPYYCGVLHFVFSETLHARGWPVSAVESPAGAGYILLEQKCPNSICQSHRRSRGLSVWNFVEHNAYHKDRGSTSSGGRLPGHVQDRTTRFYPSC